MSDILEGLSNKISKAERDSNTRMAAIEQAQALIARDAKWAGTIFGFLAAAFVEVGRVIVALFHK